MHAKVVVGTVDPGRMDEGISIVREELIPSFIARSGGSQPGYWMLNRERARVLEVTCWPDRHCLDAARAQDGAQRIQLAERIGISVAAVHTAEVIGQAGAGDSGSRPPCWARVSWVSGLSRTRDGLLRSLHEDLAPEQAAAGGFGGGYWLVDYESGNGVGVSLWADAAAMRRREPAAQCFRRRFERAVGSRVETVVEFEVVGTAGVRHPRVFDLTGADDRQVVRPG